jgi:hypothetical protein
MKMYLLFVIVFCSITFAQSSISGTVTDSDVQPIFVPTLKWLVVPLAQLLTVKENFFKLSK